MDRAPSPAVLIVVPSLNEAEHLPALLDYLSGEGAPWRHEIVVADGGSTDGSREIVIAAAARNPRIHLLDNPARLQGPGINAAVRERGGAFDYLVRIDAHAHYPPGYVGGLLSAAATRGADSVVVPMRTVGRGCFQRAAATAQNSVIGTGGAAHRMGGESGWVEHGHHALMRMSAFVGVGGYDERFSHNEDAELDLRLSASGFRIWMEKSLVLDYFPRAAAAPLLRQYTNYGRGRARTVKLHGVRLRARQALPLAVLPALVAAALAALLAWLHPLLLGLALPAAVWATACLAGGAAAARSAGSACAYGAGPVAMLMHLGWSFGFLSEYLTAPRLSPRQPQP